MELSAILNQTASDIPYDVYGNWVFVACHSRNGNIRINIDADAEKAGVIIYEGTAMSSTTF